MQAVTEEAREAVMMLELVGSGAETVRVGGSLHFADLFMEVE